MSSKKIKMVNDNIKDLKVIHDSIYELICFIDFPPEKRLKLLDGLKIYERKIRQLERHPENYNDYIYPKIFKAYTEGKNTYEYIESKKKE